MVKRIQGQSKRRIIAVALTAEDTAVLARLAKDASDVAGWTISNSAIVRGLIRFADRQGPKWARGHLQAIVEEETNRGLTWGGSRKGAGRPKRAAVKGGTPQKKQ